MSELLTMYPGIPFSPVTQLSGTIGEADTIIPVDHIDAFPAAPNLATIGSEGQGETILYTAKTSSALSGCTRGLQGTAQQWQKGELVSRNFTAKDWADIIENIQRLFSGKQPIGDYVTSVAGQLPIDGNVSLRKSDVGLGNVDNTADIDKPVSNETAKELLKKADDTLANVDDKIVLEKGKASGLLDNETADSTYESIENNNKKLENKADKTELPNKIITVTLDAAGWTSAVEDIFIHPLTHDAIVADTKLNIAPGTDSTLQTIMNDGVTGMVAKNEDGVASVIFYGAKPTADISLQVEIVPVVMV